MEKKDVNRVSDSLLARIRSYIHTVYTGEDETEEPQLLGEKSFSSILKKTKNAFVDGSTDKIIKVFSMEADEFLDESETDGYDEDDRYIVINGCADECFDQDELEDLLNEREYTFSDALLAYIDEKGWTDPQVYKKANIDRKHFQKMKKTTYRPGKAAAISLGLALELDYEALQAFIGRADHQLSHAFKSDIVIEYCVNHHIFDVFRVNEILYELNLPELSNY